MPSPDQRTLWLFDRGRTPYPTCIPLNGWLAGSGGDTRAVSLHARTTRDGITFRLRDATLPEPGLVSGTVEYAVPDADGGLLWTQSFANRRLDEEMLRRLLRSADLAFGGYLTEDHAWLRAIPA